MKISICIPIYPMQRADFFLTRCLDSIVDQTFTDYEVVITDNSDDSELEKLIKTYSLNIKYWRNPSKGMAVNTNMAIKASGGELVKILYMDDFLAKKDSLKIIAENFEGNWLVTGCSHEPGTHTHIPTWNDHIYRGVNTIGSPSVLTMKRSSALLFDEKLSWVLDCELYDRLYKKYGPPTILNDINVVIGIHPGQTTHLLPDERKEEEYNYVINKHK